MKRQLNVIALSVLAATQAHAVTANFGWEDGSTVLGQFGAAHIQHGNSLVQARTGSYSLSVEDIDPINNGTPQSFLAWVNGLTDGDVVTVNFWVYDDAAERPAGRVWGHYTDDVTDINAYAGSAGGNSAYTDGSGWQEVSHSWTFDSNSNSRDGLVVEFRLYDDSTNTTGGLFVDDIEITSTGGSITLPSGEVVTDNTGGDTGGGDSGNTGGTGAEIYISEYIEGSSNNKAIELYNPTGASIELGAGNYVLSRYSNGGTSPSNITLSGSVAAGDVFVIANSSANATILAQADQTTGSISHNGDDAYVLTKGGVVIDSFGQVGNDPGSAWGSGSTTTANNTLRRLSSVTSGDTVIDDAFDPAQEWAGFGNDQFNDLGTYNGSTGGDNGGGDNGGGTSPVVCATSFTPIHAVQGSGASTPITGEIEVEGIVTGDFQSALDGFYIQSAPGEEDADALTSEGVFVYTNASPQTVNVGDRVRVRASAAEFNGLTQLTAVNGFEVCASGQTLPAPTNVTLPFATADSAEAVEGMLISFNGLMVNDVFNLARFGSAGLSNGRRMTPTQVATPGDEANAVAAANALNLLILDDASNAQNPEVVPYPTGGLSALNTLRTGDTVSLSSGVMHYSFGDYRVFPVDAPQFTATNPRTPAPELVAEGNVNISSFNVLNYFNTLNLRGADTAEEFERQEAKIVSALAALDADIIGLMEIENDGYGTDSSISDLVNALNQVDPGSEWRFVDPGLNQVGTDQISVGMLYKSIVVAPSGATRILDSSNSAVDENGNPLFIDTKNRPTMAQEFSLLENGESVVVAVNHLKSKGSSCASDGDPDLGDGQGNCNLTRTKAAQALGLWLNQEFADKPVLVIGDMNAYAKEDPIIALANAGFAELFEHLNKEGAYSYTFQGEFGQLDHALGNAALLSKIVDATEWHINSDEPRALDYNTEFKSASQIDSLYSVDPYRSSDHDPVVVSLNLDVPIDPNLTEITVVSQDNLSRLDSFGFKVRAKAWEFQVSIWERRMARLEAIIASMDPVTQADEIASKQAVLANTQAKRVIFINLMETVKAAVSGSGERVLEVARQLALSDDAETFLLRKQMRYENRADSERAARYEARAAEFEARGKTRQAQRFMQKALELRARAQVYGYLAEVLNASLVAE
ncbi:ExeM/NucH family extracellular endonuclease [Alteromonas sp. a30]|uniref:ExeM/NucH family extracellular endonuclease n=1 Tax=Alteromonas sp. a30 TaxID=2730917 RepID=UPI002282394B|nr:ExeM/NucH family extracellular endonuclease [Alteromonas sp. a30]MCY7296685.1 ExeM/NucH family extracellular endonuclease [Alteromonas sp. a30]